MALHVQKLAQLMARVGSTLAATTAGSYGVGPDRFPLPLLRVFAATIDEHSETQREGVAILEVAEAHCDCLAIRQDHCRAQVIHGQVEIAAVLNPDADLADGLEWHCTLLGVLLR